MFDLETIHKLNNRDSPDRQAILIPLKCSKCKQTWEPTLGTIERLQEDLICPKCGCKVSLTKKIGILTSPLVTLINKQSIDLAEV